MNLSSLKTYASQYAEFRKGRGKIISLSGQALSASKRAIFSAHRGDIKEAHKLLREAESFFKSCDDWIKKQKDLSHEGSLKAALEEFVEAHLFVQYVETGSIKQIPKRARQADIVLGGLADFSGEVVRHAVHMATRGDLESVKNMAEGVEEVYGFLLSLDLTGSLRQKFDQAKRNLQRMEEIIYELSIRKTDGCGNCPCA